jgi:hypothetical protein
MKNGPRRPPSPIVLLSDLMPDGYWESEIPCGADSEDSVPSNDEVVPLITVPRRVRVHPNAEMSRPA